MSTEERRIYCPTCQAARLGRREMPNHILHFLVSFFTCGFWVIPWVFMTIAAGRQPYLCSACGTPGQSS